MSNLKDILEVVTRQMSAAGVECLLIGGFAVNYHGYTRNTLDVDFMIVTEQLEIVRKLMKQACFTDIVIEENVAFFSQPGSSLRVDFLRADGETMRKLLANSLRAKVHGCEVRLPSLRDLIAMKIFSLSRDVARRSAKDLPDIAYLSVLNNLDWDTDIKPLCARFGTVETGELVRRQIEELNKS